MFGWDLGLFLIGELYGEDFGVFWIVCFWESSCWYSLRLVFCKIGKSVEVGWFVDEDSFLNCIFF